MKHRFATYVCCISMAVVAMSITMLSPLLAEIAARFGLGIGQSGLLFSVNFLGFAAFTLAGGALSERFGKKAVLTFCSFGLAVSALLLSFANHFALVLLLMFIYGGCGGAIETFLSALISELNPDKSAYYINLTQVYFGIGAVIAPVGAGILLQQGADYTLCYLLLGVLALANALLFRTISVPRRTEAKNLTGRDLRDLAKNPVFWLACLGMCFYTGAEVGTWGWMSTFLGQTFSFTPFEASLAMASFWIAMTVGRFLCGLLSRRVALHRLIIGLSAAAAVISVALSVAGRGLFFAAAFFLGLACSSQLPFIMAYGERHVEHAKSSAFALFMVSANMGSIIIPYLIGLIGEGQGLGTAMLLPAAAFAAVALLFVTARPRQTAPTAEH